MQQKFHKYPLVVLKLIIIHIVLTYSSVKVHANTSSYVEIYSMPFAALIEHPDNVWNIKKNAIYQYRINLPDVKINKIKKLVDGATEISRCLSKVQTKMIFMDGSVGGVFDEINLYDGGYTDRKAGFSDDSRKCRKLGEIEYKQVKELLRELRNEPDQLISKSNHNN